MDYRTVSMIIDGTVCPVCGNIIKVTRANSAAVTIMHNSILPACAEFINSLDSVYLETINDKLTLAQLKIILASEVGSDNRSL